MSAQDWQIVWFTAWVSALSTLVILPFGLAAGLLLARRDWPSKSGVETILSLPLVMPPVATGLILLKLLGRRGADRKSTRLNSSHSQISYAVFCLKKKKKQ